MLNPINIAKLSAQFIYTNSSSAVTAIACSVNKVFNFTINKFIDAFKFTNNTTKCLGIWIYTNTSTLMNYIFNVVFGTSKPPSHAYNLGLPSDAYNSSYNPNYPNYSNYPN